MHRLPLITSFMVAFLFLSHARAQTSAFSIEQRYSAEKSSYEAALVWSQQRGLPAHFAFANGSAIGIVRMENRHPVYFTTHNKVAGQQTQTSTLHDGLAFGLKLTGAGMRIGIWDEGPVLEDHQELSFRVALADRGGASNHATHVAGTLIASGALDDATGMAPSAGVRSFNWNFHTSEMQSEASKGLLLSNHSYGRVAGWHQMSFGSGQKEWYWFGDPSVSEVEDYTFGYYDRDALLFDHVAHENPYYLPVVSAGNERDHKGPQAGTYKALNTEGRWVDYDASLRPIQADGGIHGFDTITSFAVAKNVLTIGSIGLQESGSTPVRSPFSSAGPTDDGRVKPDLVGLGENVLSSIGSGAMDYARYSGTSMATPNVAGSLLLLQQMAQHVRDQALRAATLKGLAIHTATDLGNPGPDYTFGWGLLNTSRAAQLIMDAFSNPGLMQEIELENGATWTEQLVHAEPGPLAITLSWTDPPAAAQENAGAARLNNRIPKLVNDLDLALTHEKTGAVYHPYLLSTSDPGALATTGDNQVDPVEQIFLETAPAGSYSLQVSHKGALIQGAAQPFSIILSGINTNTLPIVLDSVHVDAQLGEVNLAWDTRIETVPGSFVIERADLTNGLASNALNLSFEEVAHITNAGTAREGNSYQHTDAVYLKGVYQYRILFIDETTSNRMLLSELHVDIPAPNDFSIVSLFPNPATTHVQIALDLPADTGVIHQGYNLLGQRMYTSESEFLSAGRHFITFDTTSWPPGIYFMLVRSEQQQLIRKVVIMG